MFYNFVRNNKIKTVADDHFSVNDSTLKYKSLNVSQNFIICCNLPNTKLLKIKRSSKKCFFIKLYKQHSSLV